MKRHMVRNTTKRFKPEKHTENSRSPHFSNVGNDLNKSQVVLGRKVTAISNFSILSFMGQPRPKQPARTKHVIKLIAAFSILGFLVLSLGIKFISPTVLPLLDEHQRDQQALFPDSKTETMNRPDPKENSPGPKKAAPVSGEAGKNHILRPLPLFPVRIAEIDSIPSEGNQNNHVRAEIWISGFQILGQHVRISMRFDVHGAGRDCYAGFELKTATCEGGGRVERSLLFEDQFFAPQAGKKEIELLLDHERIGKYVAVEARIATRQVNIFLLTEQFKVTNSGNAIISDVLVPEFGREA
jgi:hypothetical protein